MGRSDSGTTAMAAKIVAIRTAGAPRCIRCIIEVRFTMLTMLLALALGLPAEQDASAQKLFEAGNYDGVIQKAEQERQGRFNSPETTFFVTQAYMRKEQADRAREEFERLKTLQGDEAWKAIGDAGQAIAGGDLGAALNHAKHATEVGGDNPFAHYMLGLAAARQNDFATA